MGEVWLARQVDGRVQREVALKLPGMLQHGNVWRERFSRERDILARLEHPHIARFYDAGVTETGQPWLAMECVFGTTLLDHVAARALPIPGAWRSSGRSSPPSPMRTAISSCTAT